MQYELSQRELFAIQQTINGPGHPAVEVKIENGKVTVVEIKRKLVSKSK